MQGSRLTPTILAVYGDPIICRALWLLLKSPDYDVRFVSASALGRPGALKGIHVLLVALGNDTQHRERLLAALEGEADDAKPLILELVAAFEERSGPWGEPARLGRRIPWPCSTEELKRHIKDALPNSPEETGTVSPMVADVGGRRLDDREPGANEI